MRVTLFLEAMFDEAPALAARIADLGHHIDVVVASSDRQPLERLCQALPSNAMTIHPGQLFGGEVTTGQARLLTALAHRVKPDLLVLVCSSSASDLFLAATALNGDKAHPLIICCAGDFKAAETDDWSMPTPLLNALQGPGQSEAVLANHRLEDAPDSIATAGLAGARPTLAMVGPTLPAKSGIAVYTDELVQALSAYYDITLIDTTPDAFREPDTEGPRHPDLSWFRAQAHTFDRVVYQLGNSGFHAGMLATMRAIPGVVVLHDFFVGQLRWWEYANGYHPERKRDLASEHGYKALIDDRHDDAVTAPQYPFNARVFSDSLGVMVHSRHALELTEAWHGKGVASTVEIIPLLRKPSDAANRELARQSLRLRPEDFVVCSFGSIASTKLHHQIVAAWGESALARDPRCKLILVGERGNADYQGRLDSLVAQLPFPDNVEVTGFASAERFTQYLTAADMAIQLRTQSRGETSATVLDCMNHGLPTIVNAHGSMAELDPDAVLMLADDFHRDDLVKGLEGLLNDPDWRASLACRAQALIRQQHAPDHCAHRYHEFIESCYRRGNESHPAHLLRALTDAGCTTRQAETLTHTLDDCALALRKTPRQRSLYLDITDVVTSQRRSGIERTAIELCRALMTGAPTGVTVLPVYLAQDSQGWHHKAALSFVARELSKTKPWCDDAVIEPLRGDLLMTLDLTIHPLLQAKADGLFERYADRGVKCAALVYDLLPVRLPEVFPPGADQTHAQWLATIASFDAAVGISANVADDLTHWLIETGHAKPTFAVGHIRLGSDTETFAGWRRPDSALFGTAASALLEHDMTFLMVGTLEPRKGYLQTLEAFSALWQAHFPGNLVILGREGWVGLPDEQRRDIPDTVKRIVKHPEYKKRLHWLRDANDAELQGVYQLADCLIAASYGEGFGLPLVEAARHGLPTLARDIAVFREVAPAGTRFFTADDADTLAQAISSVFWERPQRPLETPPTPSWNDCAEALLAWLEHNHVLGG